MWHAFDNTVIMDYIPLEAHCVGLQKKFSDAKGGIPLEFLWMEYKLFRRNLAGIMGKQMDEPHSTRAQSTRCLSQPSLSLRACFLDRLPYIQVCGHVMHADTRKD